ncbi:MAG: 3-oxoacyl-[acyl-carrier-protein] reductase [Planctomycetaceae bacterium]|jgi:3-oxoacyl-[acyl-carrier protein] reductase|nr:3-oxoacyl-[acyl-carrier-protein] reductase [Planctomycetaceae bacterium]MBT6485272.1 3-oxoacyl-[acyl-carrier-protein] reductase [Planctomycetaceae bacterium]MBT6494720.1 3-oxoacyl-[acyl-carrier-protein] reductase [Planctomycetaceae bacterium]
MRLAGKIALVTGGSRGIGKAVVQALAQEGAKVAFVYRSNSEAAEQLVSELELDQCEAIALQGDVASKEDADKIVEQVLEKWDKIDILVNNAGIIRDGLLATMSEENWQAVISTNLNSVFNFCQAVTRTMMSARFGRIINMSSIAADVGNPGQANYAASKGGINGFTRCIAAELARRGITVNAVSPGFIETDMTTAVRNAAGDQIKKKIPVRRLGQPQDIANAVLFLASDEAAYITGQILNVDGGLTLGGM